MKRVLYFDLVGGAAGDMLMAALADAGVDLKIINSAIDRVVHGIHVHAEEAESAGLRAKRIDVHVHDHHGEHQHDHDEPHDHHHPHRPYRVVRELVEKAELDDRVKQTALAVFKRLAEAEGKVHGVDPEAVEFHEVGSDDAIADVVGVAAAIHALGIDEIICSPFPLGRGMTRGAHGPIPLPAPATVELLRGLPVEGVALTGETVTPTGAAILTALSDRYGPAPQMIVETIGVGAGARAWPDRPNIVRAFIGRAHEASTIEVAEDCIIEANIDDMTPEHVAVLSAELFRAGALDVWSMPISMKKGRTGTLIAALARRTTGPAISDAFFRHSTTLGVRIVDVARRRRERSIEEVETPYGRVKVKIARYENQPPLVAPEHDDCERLAREAGVSVRTVYEAAQFAVWSKGA